MANIPSNPKINTLPADLKAIAEEMLETKFPSSPEKTTVKFWNERGLEIEGLNTEPGTTFGAKVGHYVRARFRGYETDKSYYGLISRRDLATVDVNTCINKLAKDLERRYSERMYLKEIEDGDVNYAKTYMDIELVTKKYVDSNAYSAIINSEMLMSPKNFTV